MGRSENNEPSELIPAPVILSDFENEPDNTILENHGYQLLTDNDLQEPPDNQLTSNLETETTPTDTDNVETYNEIPHPDKNDDPPRDIIVDFEQVRAVMSRITLPLSAMPPWAADIPDAELGSFLRNRITSLQQGNSPPNESQGDHVWIMNAHSNNKCSKVVGCTCQLLPVVQLIADKYKYIVEESAENASGQHVSLFVNNPLRKLSPFYEDYTDRMSKSYSLESNDDGAMKESGNKEANTKTSISNISDSPTDSALPSELFHVSNQSCPVHAKNAHQPRGNVSLSNSIDVVKSVSGPPRSQNVSIMFNRIRSLLKAAGILGVIYKLCMYIISTQKNNM